MGSGKIHTPQRLILGSAAPLGGKNEDADTDCEKKGGGRGIQKCRDESECGDD